MYDDKPPTQLPSQSPLAPRPPRWRVICLSAVVALQMAILWAIWGQDPLLVNYVMPHYYAWKQARREARWARQQLSLHQPVPTLRVKGVAGAHVPRLRGRSTLLLFVGRCQG